MTDSQLAGQPSWRSLGRRLLGRRLLGGSGMALQPAFPLPSRWLAERRM